jgi:hypothetical protein
VFAEVYRFIVFSFDDFPIGISSLLDPMQRRFRGASRSTTRSRLEAPRGCAQFDFTNCGATLLVCYFATPQS